MLRLTTRPSGSWLPQLIQRACFGREGPGVEMIVEQIQHLELCRHREPVGVVNTEVHLAYAGRLC